MERDDRAHSKTSKVKRNKLIDILIGAALIILCLVLAKSLYDQLSLKHEVSAATAITNRVVSDIRKQNGADVRSLGDKTFQSQNSTANLTAQFKAASKLTGSTPVIERKTVTNSDSNQAVSILYKFPKPVFYVRVIVVKTNGSDKFKLVNLKANTTAKPLLDNKY